MSLHRCCSVNRIAQLDALAGVCRECRRCDLAAGRQQVVFGRGNPASRLLLIGEAPGADEDRAGQPFVGRSGQLLEQLLQQAGFDSHLDLYIANAIKCRPPANRRPSAVELDACRPWLLEQIRLLDPALLLLVGATALEAVLGIRGGITRLRGQWLTADRGPLQVELAGRRLMPILHPSYLLRFASEAPGSPRDLTRGDLQQVHRQLSAPL